MVTRERRAPSQPSAARFEEEMRRGSRKCATFARSATRPLRRPRVFCG